MLIQNRGFSDNFIDELMIVTSQLIELDERRESEKPDDVSRFGVELR